MSAKRHALAVLLATLPALCAVAQQNNPDDAQAPGEVTLGEKGSDQDPLSGKDQGLAVEPQRQPSDQQVEGAPDVPALSVKIDPRTLGVSPGQPLPSLRREGEAIRKRDGKLLPTGEHGDAVFILDPDPDTGDTQPLGMFIAPCMALESMERLQEDRGERLRFTLTGEVHTYRGVNYLLPTSQPKPWLDEDAQDTTPIDQSAETTNESTPPAEPNDDTAATAPDEQAGNNEDQTVDKSQATPSADEVLEELLKQRRDAPAQIQPTGSGTSADNTANTAAPQLDVPAKSGLLTDPLLQSLDPDQPQAELKQEGEFLIARTGRLIHTSDGSHALFVLDSDQRGAPEPPMIMQACKLLETMEKTVQEQGDDVPFVVTGQVYVYRGANYLLPTIVKREFDRGNLE